MEFNPPVGSAVFYGLQDVKNEVREVGGKNRGPLIDTINQRVGNPLGAPYCAAGVSWDFWNARKRALKPRLHEFPYSGSSQAIRWSFAKMGRLFWDAQLLSSIRGALGGWTNKGDASHGHVFIVAQRLTVNGKVTGIRTVEYNTDLSGDRDGQGVYMLTRRKTLLGWKVEDARGRLVGPARKLWFCDTTSIIGGSWWL